MLTDWFDDYVESTIDTFGTVVEFLFNYFLRYLLYIFCLVFLWPIWLLGKYLEKRNIDNV